MFHELPDSDLFPWHVPGPDAPWRDVVEFALTCNGYRVFRDASQLAEFSLQARARYAQFGELPVTLRSLRCLLFFEVREDRWVNSGIDPSDEQVERVHAILAAIAAISEEAARTPLPRPVAHMVIAWRGAHDAWLANRSLPAPFDLWFGAYAGTGQGAVDANAMPEPWIGPLERRPLPVLLGLNPGGTDATFQHRDGFFANQIAPVGYPRWAAANPYLNDANWLAAHPNDPYAKQRRKFLIDFENGDERAGDDLLVFEAYPWHSVASTASIRTPPWLLRELVLEPAAALTDTLIAFGAQWHKLADDCALDPIRPLDEPDWDKDRTVRLWRLAGRKLLITTSHPGTASPLTGDDVTTLSLLIDAERR